MRNKLAWLCIATSLFVSSIAHAQSLTVESLPFSPKAEIWLIEQHDLPLVTLDIAFRDAGASSDVKGKEGRARMLAALLDEGAGKLDGKTFQQQLDAHAIRLSFSADGDVLHVHLETLSEHLDKALELLGLALTQPQLEAGAVQRVKAQMLAGLKQQQENPEYLAGRKLTQMLFGSHPYANPVEGTEAGIIALTEVDLREYLAHYVTKGNILVSAAGDVTEKSLQKQIQQYLQALPDQFTPEKTVPDLQIVTKAEREVIPFEQPQTVVLLAAQGIARNDKEFYAAYVLNHLLGGGTLTSKLADEIREKNGLAYYAYSGLQPMEHASLFVGGFGTRNEQAGEALKIYLQTLETVKNGAVSEKELQEAKQYIIGAFPLSLDSNEKLSGMLMTMQRFHLGKDYLQKRNQIMADIRMEHIKKVAKRLLEPHNLAVVAIGKPDEKRIREQ